MMRVETMESGIFCTSSIKNSLLGVCLLMKAVLMFFSSISLVIDLMDNKKSSNHEKNSEKNC